jgi:phage tail sheath protein FI
MAEYKTPGVYVEEISTLPPSVAGVATAVPAFIGYTEKSSRNGKSLINSPTHVTSMLDFHMMFGGAAALGDITVNLNDDNSVNNVQTQYTYYLYNSVKLYFANGGGECYIVSVGLYGDEISVDALDTGLAAVEKQDHPTILLSPDAMLLEKKDQAYSFQQAMLAQCNSLQDRVAVLDVFNGHIDRADEDVVLDFRNGIGINFLKYGAAYYPWILSTYSASFGFEDVKILDKAEEEINLEDLVSDPSSIINLKNAIEDLKSVNTFVANPKGEEGDFSESFYKIPADKAGTMDEAKTYLNFIKDSIDKIIEFKGSGLKNNLIINELNIKSNASSPLSTLVKGLASIDSSLGSGVINAESDYAQYDLANNIESSMYEGLEDAAKIKKAISALKGQFESLTNILSDIKSDSIAIKDSLDKIVYDTNNFYKNVVNEIQKSASLIPPSGAIAGVYSQVDSDRGVWKAPANVSLSSTSSPCLRLDNKQQEDLNVDVTAGKSINAIRPFTGQGTLVWGARTLAGNDNEWRYVSVRRFFNMVEKSLKLSTNWAVFEPNDVNTWTRVQGMIENYLTNLWKQGALAGATTDAAFFVNIGLGSTMSQVDILEGRMNIEIGMAVVRPAEFIILKFSHKLQES